MKIKRFSNAAMVRIFSELEIQDSRLYKVAENIETFRKKFWNYKTPEIRNREIQKLIKLTKKKDVFRPFHEWFKVLDILHRENSATRTALVCNKNKQDHDALQQKMTEICHALFLSRLGNEIKVGGFVTPIHLSYIKNNFRTLSKSHRQLNKLLIRTKKNQNVYPILINELKALYNNNSTYKISKALSQKLNIKNVPKKKQEKEIFSVSDTKYKLLKENVSRVISLIDENATEDKIREKTKDTVFTYYEKNKDLLPQTDSLERILKLGEYFTRRKKYIVAREIFGFVDSRTSKFEQDIHFGLLWGYIQKKDYTQALVYIRYNKLDKKYKSSDSKVNYWVSHVLSKRNDERSATKLLNFVIKNNPLSYYAIMAAKRVNVLSEKPIFGIDSHPYHLSLKSNEHDFKIDPEKLPIHIKNSFSRLQLFASLDRSPLMKYELSEIFDSLHELRLLFPKASLTQIKADFSLLTAHILHKNHKYLETFRLIYKGVDKKYLSFTPQVIKMLFPKPYLSEVSKQLDKEIDPLMVLSLMRQESSFNPIAQSPVGARGLMQLMPATARRFKRRVKKKQLNNPKTNIKLGTQYIEYLMNRFQNNVVYTLAAYNAGEGNVDYWKKNYFKEQNIMQDIENIPFQETRKYVKLIYRNIFLYKFINAQDQLSDTAKPGKIFDLSLNYPKS